MQQYITTCDSEKTALQSEAEPETDYAGSAESVLIRIPDDVVDALCAEPAIRKYSHGQVSLVQLTICCQHADLYVGHPSVSGIMYDLSEGDELRFRKTIVLNQVNGQIDERVASYAEQLGVDAVQENPRIYLTSLDWIRIGRFGLSKMNKPTVAIVLSGDAGKADRFNELALMLKEQYEAGIVFLSSRKQEVLEECKNLTGRLMSREVAAVLSKVDCWVSDCPSTAVLSRAVESKGVLLGEQASENWPRVEIMAFDTANEKICQSIAALCEQE